MIITRTPLRIPLGGGGTDLPSYYRRFGGYLVSAAIDKYVYITIQRRFEDNFRISYSQSEIVDAVDQIKHPLVREALQLLGIETPLEIVSLADAPANTGLGSSSSYLVGLLLALHAFRGEHPAPQQLAEEACHIEIERLGEPIGKQDQYMAAFGGVTSLCIEPDGTVEARSLPLCDEVIGQFEHDVMFFYTGIRRSASEVLVDQSGAVQRGDEAVAGSLHAIKRIGYDVTQRLLCGDLPGFGGLLHEHWEAKKQMSAKISSAEIDRWYDVARRQGALGGKLMGAGGGGFFMLYVGDVNKQRMRQAMTAEGLRETPMRIERGGAKVMLNL